MDIRSVIALFLGLVIQFSQVPLRSVSPPLAPCATTARVMACCEGLEACPCAKETPPNHKPAPAIPAGAELKVVIAKASGNHDAFIPDSVPIERLALAVSQTEFRGGYAGVPLSVAFCSHVI